MSKDKTQEKNGYKVVIFVDFWNYTLSMSDHEQGFKTDWKKLPQTIVSEAINVVDASAHGIYSGMHVYGSFDETGDAKLKKWATTVLDTFPGVNVKFVPRQRKKTGPKCPHCHLIAEHCSHCGADMRGTEEKGVDTAIAVDMISLAWEGSYDVAVLISSDRDFAPVVEYLATKGKKVIHGAFPPKGALLSQKSWGSIDIASFRAKYQR